jgi:uncharacterized protein (TIGR02466 family)
MTEPKLDYLFPKPLFTSNIDRAFTTEEFQFIKKNKEIFYPNYQNTTSIDHDILEHREMADIRGFVNNCLKAYVDKVMSPIKPTSLYVTQSWLNFSEPGQSHHVHTHPNSYVSGVFYINAEDGKDRINFHRSDTEFFQIVPKEYTPFNSPIYWNPVKTGDLILFPSHIAHNVDPTESSGTRISLAFNTFLKGNIGIEENLTRLWL